MSKKEDQSLTELDKRLSCTDFSQYADRQAVWLAVKVSQQKQEEKRMIKKIRRRTAIALSTTLAVGLLSIIIAQPSAAQSMMNKVLATFNLGHIEVYQLESPQESSRPTEPFEGSNESYTNDDPNVMVSTEDVETASENTLILTDFSEVSKYAEFNVKLPQYLPEGYSFDRAELYGDSKEVSGKYVSLYFTNKDKDGQIFMQQRLPSEETAFAMSVEGEVQELNINGFKAVTVVGRSIDWENSEALYGLSSRDLNQEELVRIAESIQP